MVRNGLIITFISLAIIFVLEAGLRLFAPQLGTNIYSNGIGMSARDPDIGYVLAPNSMNIQENREFDPDSRIEYRVSEQGFRDHQVYQYRKPRNVLRILVLGDSFAFGIGNRYEKIWPVILERKLNARGYAVEVMKAGIYGYDTRREVLYLKKLYPDYRPDIVVINFMFNDLFTNRLLSRSLEERHRLNRETDTVLSEYAATKVSSLHLLALAKRILLSSDMLYSNLYMITRRGDFFDSGSRLLKRQVGVTKLLLGEALKYLAPTNTDLVVLSLPQAFQVINTKQDIDVGYIDREFGRFADKYGFSWIPVRETLADVYRDTGRDLYYRVDGHLNNFGNRVVGEYFAQELEYIVQKRWWRQRIVDRGAGLPDRQFVVGEKS